MKSISVYCLICIFHCVSFFPEAKAQAAEDSLFQQADSLFSRGNYFEAGIGYERIFFFSSDAEKKVLANLARAEALKQSGDFARAKNDLQRSAHVRNYPDLHFQVLYQIALCDYMLGNYNATLSSLMQTSRFYPNQSKDGEVLLLYALAAIMNEDWELASQRSLVLIESKEHSINEKEYMQQVGVLFAEDNIPRLKSEDKASTLSAIIPGSGHLYAGYAGKGIINASSQLLSLGVAGFMIYHKLYVSGFVMGLGMFQSFYFGGIKQASFLANQRNLIRMAHYKEELKDFVISVYEL